MKKIALGLILVLVVLLAFAGCTSVSPEEEQRQKEEYIDRVYEQTMDKEIEVDGYCMVRTTSPEVYLKLIAEIEENGYTIISTNCSTERAKNAAQVTTYFITYKK